jgi:hypothetical protein
VRREGDPRHLRARLALFFLAAAVFIVGLISERQELALVALAILGLALVLRFLSPPGGRRQPDHDPGDEAGGPDAR